ncbi:hypothetical protein IAU60_004805 [Kwoniella sp. DSM 27419]
MDDDPFSLPLFNHHPAGGTNLGSGALPPIRTSIMDGPGTVPPPPPSAHRSNFPSAGALASLFSASPRSAGVAHGPPPVSNRPHASSTTSAMSYNPTTYQPSRADELVPPQAGRDSGYLGRSASLGGARKKDPFAYRSDDVESGLGQMEVSDHAGSSRNWAAYGSTSGGQQGYHQYQQQSLPHVQTRDVTMSPNKPQQGGGMNPPPLPAHISARQQQQPPVQQTHMDSAASSPAQMNYQSSGHGQSNSVSNPYIPQESDSSQWTDYRRPSFNQRMSSNGSYHSHGSGRLSPYHKPAPLGDTPSSPLLNPYDASPNLAPSGFSSPIIPPTQNVPTASHSPRNGLAWASGSRPHVSPVGGRPSPSARQNSNQLYAASQPATPAGKYEMSGRHVASRDGKTSPSRTGFRDIHGWSDLKPQVNSQPNGRRADPDAAGKFLSPLKCLTTALPQTYSLCNPSFRYETSDNPRRVLTKPSKPVHNDGADNEDWDYILYVNDVLGGENGGDRYLILDVLGQGTFGQVVKCQNMRTHDICAVKVVKNKPAYLHQSKMEVAILDLLNTQHDPNDRHHILRMLESFTHKSHLCLVFECLSSNLYELIKQNQFKGLSTQLVKVFTQQLLDCLTVLKDARLIHCDLKPENILLKSLQSPQIKVIDFGSACHEMQTVYTYIQSRFYRSPEVLLGLPYSTSIDMWSLGCIVVELFLGLPLFPGTSEYNQISRIVDMLGNPPSHLLEVGKQTHEFFNISTDSYGRKQFKLKSMHQYASEHRTDEQPSKQYFKQSKLKDIIMEYPFAKRNAKQSDIDKEMSMRRSFVDFAEGLLNMDPIKRWSPQQAAKHPFITGDKFTGPFQPTVPGAGIKKSSSSSIFPSPADSASVGASAASPSSSSKKYGGLVQSPSASRNQRIYSDAAAYNQQLAQHQSYTAQVQSANSVPKPGPFSPGYDMQHKASQPAHSGYGQHRVPSQQMPVPQIQQRQPSGQWQSLPLQAPYQQQQQRAPSLSSSASHAGLRQPPTAPMMNAATNPPPNSYYPASRNRANTINQMDAIPPALARLVQFGAADPSGTRNSLTPVMNRDDHIREWEKRQSGHSKQSSLHNASYPQLEYLQEQAELAAMGGQNWLVPGQYATHGHHNALAPSHGHGGHAHGHGHPGHRANASMSMSGTQGYQMQPHIGISPPQSASTTEYSRRDYEPSPHASSRASYAGQGLPAFPPPAATSNPNSSAFDAFDTGRDGNLGMMYTSLQPSAYGGGGGYARAHSHGHGTRASYSGPYGGGGNPFAPPPQSSGQGPVSPRYPSGQGQGQGQRRSQYGA